MKSICRRAPNYVCAALVVPLATHAIAADNVQPEAIWGAPVQIVAPTVFGAFKDWAVARLSKNTQEGSPHRLGVNIAGAALAFVAEAAVTPQGRATLLGDPGKPSLAMPGPITAQPVEPPPPPPLPPEGAPLRPAPPVVAVQENTTVGTPAAPLQIENGRANYEGVHIAIVGADRSGRITGFRPVSAGFRAGERFKLRVLATFPGFVVISDITLRGDTRQIYPARPQQVVQLKDGEEAFLPLGSDEFFEFADATGREQLVVTVRDPRAFGGAQSTTRAFRQDDDNGSNFVQEVKPGSYAVISQGVEIEHRPR